MKNDISQKDYLYFSDKELISIADLIENNDENSIFDIEYLDGILTITDFIGGSQYVINQHQATKKIWFSSPISGANYFIYSSDDIWVDDEGKKLRDILFNELKSNFNFNLK